MKYNKIRKMDISDGTGVRVSIFMQGCAFNCKNCFNPETHDFNGGKEFTDDTINRVMELCENENVEGLSILGGEPMHPKNIEGTTKLAKTFKEKFPNKNLWAWTGFQFDKDLKDKDALKYIDVLVDGQFVEELHDPTLKWRGSSNQHIIDVDKWRQTGKISYINEQLEQCGIEIFLDTIVGTLLVLSTEDFELYVWQDQ